MTGIFWVSLAVLGNCCAATDFDYALSRQEVSAITLMGTDIWVATFDGGVVCLDEQLHVKTQLTAREGLPSVHSTGLAPDGNGGLWIGTVSGPSHREKDGKLDCPEKIAGLHTSDINAVTIAGDKVWFATNEGVRLYDPHYSGKPAWDRLPADPELDPVMRKQWGEVPRLLAIDKKTGKPVPKPTWLYLITPAQTVLDDLYSILWDGQSIWLGGMGRLYRYCYSGDNWVTVPLPSDSECSFLTSLASAGDFLYIGTSSGLFILKDRSIPHPVLSPCAFPRWVVNALLYWEGQLLVGCEKGIYSYNPIENTFYCLLQPPPGASRVTALMHCSKGWLVGSDAGLWLYPQLAASSVPTQINLGDQLPRSDVWALAPADGGVYLATGKGLALWRNEERLPQNLAIPDLAQGVFAMCRIKNLLWMAKSSGLVLLDLSRNNPALIAVKGLTEKHISVVAERVQGGVWAASGNLIFTVEGNNRLGKVFILPKECERVTSLWQDGDKLYVGTWGMGVAALDVFNGHLVQVYDDEYSLGSDLVYCIKPLSPHRLIVGEQDAGLDVIELDSGEPVDHINSNDGLSHTDILNIMEEPGEVWISVRGVGLNILDKANRDIKVINSREGLGDSYVKDILRTGDFVYMATAGGVCRINTPRKSWIVDFWGKDKPLETILPKGKRAAREVTFEVPGMLETISATLDSPAKINQ